MFNTPRTLTGLKKAQKALRPLIKDTKTEKVVAASRDLTKSELRRSGSTQVANFDIFAAPL